MIESIEKLGAKFDSRRLRQPGLFGHRQVEIVDSPGALRIASEIAYESRLRAELLIARLWVATEVADQRSRRIANRHGQADRARLPVGIEAAAIIGRLISAVR